MERTRGDEGGVGFLWVKEHTHRTNDDDSFERFESSMLLMTSKTTVSREYSYLYTEPVAGRYYWQQSSSVPIFCSSAHLPMHKTQTSVHMVFFCCIGITFLRCSNSLPVPALKFDEHHQYLGIFPSRLLL